MSDDPDDDLLHGLQHNLFNLQVATEDLAQTRVGILKKLLQGSEPTPEDVEASQAEHPDDIDKLPHTWISLLWSCRQTLTMIWEAYREVGEALDRLPSGLLFHSGEAIGSRWTTGLRELVDDLTGWLWGTETDEGRIDPRAFVQRLKDREEPPQLPEMIKRLQKAQGRIWAVRHERVADAETRGDGEEAKGRSKETVASLVVLQEELLDETGQKISAIIGDESLDADAKLRGITYIDARFFFKNSEPLGKLLSVTGAAIRKTDWWRIDRKKALADVKQAQAERMRNRG